MSYQFGNNCYGGPPAPQQGLSGYGQSYNTGQQNYRGQQTPYNNSSSYGYGGGSANYQQNPNNGYTSSTSQYKGIYGGQQQQMNCQNGQCTPQVSVMSPGTQLDPNVKVIKLNWGDILGTANQSGAHNMNVAMLGAKGDLQTTAPGLKVTFNGEVPQGMPCHVMSINPYANVLGGGSK